MTHTKINVTRIRLALITYKSQREFFHLTSNWRKIERTFSGWRQQHIPKVSHISLRTNSPTSVVCRSNGIVGSNVLSVMPVVVVVLLLLKNYVNNISSIIITTYRYGVSQPVMNYWYLLRYESASYVWHMKITSPILSYSLFLCLIVECRWAPAHNQLAAIRSESIIIFASVVVTGNKQMTIEINY